MATALLHVDAQQNKPLAWDAKLRGKPPRKSARPSNSFRTG